MTRSVKTKTKQNQHKQKAYTCLHTLPPPQEKHVTLLLEIKKAIYHGIGTLVPKQSRTLVSYMDGFLQK